MQEARLLCCMRATVCMLHAIRGVQRWAAATGHPTPLNSKKQAHDGPAAWSVALLHSHSQHTVQTPYNMQDHAEWTAATCPVTGSRTGTSQQHSLCAASATSVACTKALHNSQHGYQASHHTKVKSMHSQPWNPGLEVTLSDISAIMPAALRTCCATASAWAAPCALQYPSIPACQLPLVTWCLTTLPLLGKWRTRHPSLIIPTSKYESHQ